VKTPPRRTQKQRQKPPMQPQKLPMQEAAALGVYELCSVALEAA